MLATVSGVIDGRKWRQDRLRHLQAQLDADTPDDQRRAIEAEIEKLKAEAGSSRRRWGRWFLWGGRLPGP
jgi:hypothetical protein